MDKPQFILGLFATVMGGLLLWVIIPAQHIPPMMSSVSPDFYPNIGTVILLAGGIGMVIAALRSQPVYIEVGSLLRTIRFCGLMVLLFGVTLIAFKFLNFLAGGVILVLATMWLLGERRPIYLIAVSAISPVLIWLFIDVLLGRTLP